MDVKLVLHFCSSRVGLKKKKKKKKKMRGYSLKYSTSFYKATNQFAQVKILCLIYNFILGNRIYQALKNATDDFLFSYLFENKCLQVIKK